MKKFAAVSLAVVGLIGTAYYAETSASQGTFLAGTIDEHEQAYIQYIAKYRKTYATKEEYQKRLSHFTEANKFIQAHNAQNGSFTLAHNHMSDWTPYERKQLNGYKAEWKTSYNPVMSLVNLEIPSSKNWVEEGAVTPVKNQGSCGSCWAFSTTGSLEGLHYIQTGSLVSLSEQNLVDCDKTCNGCNGGLMDYAFAFIKQESGLDTEASYPYEGLDDTCRFKSSSVGATDSGFVDVAKNDISALKQAIAKQPVSVAIEADTMTFQYYSSGVLDSTDCGTSLDHGVLAVGYGTESGKDYFLVKNSWGASWGESGYVKIAAADEANGGICGILKSASYPTNQ